MQMAPVSGTNSGPTGGPKHFFAKKLSRDGVCGLPRHQVRGTLSLAARAPRAGEGVPVRPGHGGRSAVVWLASPKNRPHMAPKGGHFRYRFSCKLELIFGTPLRNPLDATWTGLDPVLGPHFGSIWGTFSGTLLACVLRKNSFDALHDFSERDGRRMLRSRPLK